MIKADVKLTLFDRIFLIWYFTTLNFAMKKQKHQLAALSKQDSESIFLIDINARILDANKAACNLLGYTKEELTRLTVKDLLSADEDSRYASSVETLSKGKIIQGEWKIKRKDQQIFRGIVSSRKLKDDCLEAIVREISQEPDSNASNQRFQLPLDHLLEGCQVMGFDWRYLYLNRTAEIHNRRPNADLLGNRFQDIWPGIEETEVFRFIKLSLEDRISIVFEYEFVFPDDSKGWFDLSIQPVPEGVFILSIDITERKKVEQSLRDNEAKYRLVIDNTTEWIYWMTPEKKLNYISPACQTITGYSMEDFIDNPGLIMEIAHPEYKEKLQNHFSSIGQLNESHQFEFRIITKTGDTKWISHTCSPILDSDGKFLGRRAVNRNISDLKHKEEQLRESELRFAKLYEKGPFGMAIIGTDFKWKSVNSAMENLFGYSENELQKMTFLEVTHPDDRDLNVENVRKLISNDIQVFRSEKRYVRKNGQIFWGALTVTANFNDEGTHLYNLAIIEDISQRKRDEESIEAQNALLNSILNSSSDVIIFALDRNYCYTSFNEKHRKEMKKAWGANISVGNNLLDLMHIPEVREKACQSIERTWKGEAFTEVQYQPFPPAFYEFNWSPIFKKGEVVGTVVFVKDITQSKVAEQALRESEEKFRAIFHANPDSITITRIADGMYYAVNKGFTQLFGFTEEEVIGRTSKDIDLWVDYAERNQVITTLKKNGYVENYEIRLKGKDQLPKAMLISSIFIDIDGELCILTDARDISEIKRSQEKLQKSEALLNEVGYIAKIGGWEYSPVTNEGSWTDEVARIHDLDPKIPASISRSLSYYTEQSRPVIEEAFKNCLEHAKPYDLELEIISATGQSKWIRTIGQPIVENSKVVKVHGAFQDITETITARQELIQAKERAEAGDKLKTAFINNISHEIRTPLNGIMGFSQIIIDPYFPLEDKILCGQWLNESCERLMTTVTNIMDLSLLTSGNYIARKNNAQVISILQRAGEGFSFLCQNRNLVIHVDSGKVNDTDSIFTDENIVSRILFQLVDNAVKFTEKGTITISASRNHADYLFQVSDTGIGISEEFKSQMYNFFTQIDNSVTRKYEGTGIGLSIAKGFVDLLGGNIWVESEKGKGTSFFVTIPVN